MIKQARDYLLYLVGRMALFLATLLPERLAYGTAAMLGRAYFRCSRRRQRIALRMLRNAYPDRNDRELWELAARATGNICKVPLDMVRATREIERGRLLDFVDRTGVGTRIPKPPFIALTGHLGSWEIAAVSVAQVTHEAHAVARVFKNPLLNDFITTNRRKAGLHLHPRRGGIRGLQQALARGAVGLQAVDQNQRLRGVFVPFFGELASTERAAVTLALRHRYPLVVGGCERLGPGFKFRLWMDDPFVPECTGNRNEDVRNAAVEVNRRLEQHILACPDQYLWIHDRYRTTQAEAMDPGPETPSSAPKLAAAQDAPECHDQKPNA